MIFVQGARDFTYMFSGMVHTGQIQLAINLTQAKLDNISYHLTISKGHFIRQYKVIRKLSFTLNSKGNYLINSTNNPQV